MEYKYLGIIFKPSGIFTNAVELLCKKATKLRRNVWVPMGTIRIRRH